MGEYYMNTKCFKDLNIGDRLWSFELGSCEVIFISKDLEVVTLSNKTHACVYDFLGFSQAGTNVSQTLFFRNPINTMEYNT
jgi:hypothetical protein